MIRIIRKFEKKELKKFSLKNYSKKMPQQPLAFCKRTSTLTFFDNFSALCPLLPLSLQVKEKHIAFAPRDVPELRDGSIAVNIRLSSGRSFRGNSAEPPP